MKRKGKNDFVYTCLWMNDLGKWTNAFCEIKSHPFPPKIYILPGTYNKPKLFFIIGNTIFDFWEKLMQIK